MRDSFWYLLIGGIYLGILMLLVRPSSKGPAIINQLFDAFASLLKGTTGYGTQKQ
jgi:hypothetical protein